MRAFWGVLSVCICRVSDDVGDGMNASSRSRRDMYLGSSPDLKLEDKLEVQKLLDHKE
jgi:hypothetical protein